MDIVVATFMAGWAKGKFGGQCTSCPPQICLWYMIYIYIYIYTIIKKLKFKEVGIEAIKSNETSSCNGLLSTTI